MYSGTSLQRVHRKLLRKRYMELKLSQDTPKVQGINGDNLMKNQKKHRRRAGDAGKNQVLWD